jgi:hypothetical protein
MGFGTGIIIIIIIIIYGSFFFFCFFFPFVQSISFTIKISLFLSSESLTPDSSGFVGFFVVHAFLWESTQLINAEFDYHLILMMIMILRTS